MNRPYSHFHICHLWRTIFGAPGAAVVTTFGSTALAASILSLVGLFWSGAVYAIASRALARREI